MASKRISELPAAGALDGSEQIPLTQNGETRRIPSDTYEKALNLVHDVTHSDYGALGDRSVSDTAAIDAAIDAVPDGGIVFFPTPSGAYRCDTNLAQINKSVTLMGGGGRTTNSARFGDSSWDSDNENGAVLEAHATSGAFIESDATTFGRSVNIAGLVIKGRGDATRTTTGVLLHTQAGQSYWEGVSVLNFQTGLDLDTAQDCAFYGLITRGNQVGIETRTNANQNVWYQWDSSNDTTGVLATSGVLNAFYGGAIQGYDVAIHVVGGTQGHYNSVYLESGKASGTHAVLFDGASNPDDNQFVNLHYGGSVDAVEVGVGNGNYFYLGKTKPGSITFASGTANNRVEGRNVGTITDNGDNVVLDWTDGFANIRTGGNSLGSALALTASGGTSHLRFVTPGSWGDLYIESRDDIARWRMRNGPKAYDWIAGRDNGDTPQLGFFNTGPVGQQTAPAALTDNSGGTADDTVAAVSGSGDDATINDNFAELAQDVDELRTALVNLGLIS